MFALSHTTTKRCQWINATLKISSIKVRHCRESSIVTVRNKTIQSQYSVPFFHSEVLLKRPFPYNFHFIGHTIVCYAQSLVCERCRENVYSGQEWNSVPVIEDVRSQ